MTKVFRDYDQAGLDAEYNNQAKVPNGMALMEGFAKESATLRESMPGRLNIAVGPDGEETLDIFPAEEADGPAPIQFFIHGGYWRMLSKDEFSYVARAFTPKGCATVVVNYGLIPNIDMDELVRQCRAGLAWTWRNAESFGGDRDRIFISGHSAGGHLVAMLMATDWPSFDDQSPSLPGDLIRGGCGISGLYDLEPIRLCFLNEVLNLSEAEAARNSPVLLKPGGPGPLLLTLGGKEGPEYLRQSEDLAAAWRQAGLDVTVKVLEGQDHFSIVAQLADGESELSRMILQQMGL